MTIIEGSVASLLYQTSSVAENEARAFGGSCGLCFVTGGGSDTAPLTTGTSGS